jgi:hypothetical protein
MTGQGWDPTPSTAVVPTAPTDDEIAAIKKRGTAAIAHRRELAKLERQIYGLSWGAGNQLVTGESFSPMQRAVFAEFCAITRANPMIHVDLLGGKPYLNAQYWSDLVAREPRHVRFDQRDISPAGEEALRGSAKRYRDAAAELHAYGDVDGAKAKLARALEIEDEAERNALARAAWKAPTWATDVVETTIYRFIDATPLERIRSGEITEFERYIVAVVECNWAGGRPHAPGRGHQARR